MRTSQVFHPLESAAVVFDRIRAGDAHARDRVLARDLPVLDAGAPGRLPLAVAMREHASPD